MLLLLQVLQLIAWLAASPVTANQKKDAEQVGTQGKRGRHGVMGVEACKVNEHG